MKRKSQSQQVDTSFAQAARLLLPQRDRAEIFLIGCGGTGSWLAPALARLSVVSRDCGRDVRLTFIDGDTVEAGNIPRQNFCNAEIGQNKAIALATRYSAAWGLEIAAVPQMVKPQHLGISYSTIAFLIGCVDNAAARKTLAGCLEHNSNQEAHRVWWLDCGNSNESGQILFGSAPTAKHLAGCFKSAKVCTALPSPALVAPDLLKPRPEELPDNRMSCAEMMQANLQSLAVNQRVAAEAADYLMRLLTGQPLKRFATFFDLPSGSAKSRAITPEEIAALIKKPVEYLQR